MNRVMGCGIKQAMISRGSFSPFIRSKAWSFVKSTGPGRVLLLTSLFALVTSPGAVGETCPTGATASGVILFVEAFRVLEGSPSSPVGGGSVGRCGKIKLRATVTYLPIDAFGGTVAATSGGTITISNLSGSFHQDVTPPGGMPVIGPPECGGSFFFQSDFTDEFEISAHEDDIDASGNIVFIAGYGPLGTVIHLGEGISNLLSGSSLTQVHIAARLSCSVTPPTVTVCPGCSTTLTARVSGGAGPYTFQWTKPDGSSAFGAALTISNPLPGDAGIYSVTVTDAFACSNSSQASLTVGTAPTLRLSLSEGLILFGSPGDAYRIDWTDSLNPPATWLPLTTNTLTTDRCVIPIDRTEPGPERFYRAVGIGAAQPNSAP